MWVVNHVLLNLILLKCFLLVRGLLKTMLLSVKKTVVLNYGFLIENIVTFYVIFGLIVARDYVITTSRLTSEWHRAKMAVVRLITTMATLMSLKRCFVSVSFLANYCSGLIALLGLFIWVNHHFGIGTYNHTAVKILTFHSIYRLHTFIHS